jgi:hypothetical protein
MLMTMILRRISICRLSTSAILLQVFAGQPLAMILRLGKTPNGNKVALMLRDDVQRFVHFDPWRRVSLE